MKTEIKPYTPWTLSFRRWAAKLRPGLPVGLPSHPVEWGASSPTPARDANLLTINENNLAALSC